MSETLSSWKEIANYLRRGVRTVQRWEQQYRLPVHRPAGKDRSAVFALASEIDYWQQHCPIKDGNGTGAGDGNGATASDGKGNGHFAMPAQQFQRVRQNAQRAKEQTVELRRRTETLQTNLNTARKWQDRFEEYRKGHPRAS
jgi:hypothetical protein